MCECKVKIQLEINGGSIYKVEPREEIECGGFSQCLDCLEIDNLEDGVYIADMLCEVHQCRDCYGGVMDYTGSSVLENIIKKK